MAEAATATTAAETTPSTTEPTPATTQAAPATGTAPQTETTQVNGATSAASDWRAGLDGELKEFASRLASPADAVKVALDFRKQNSAMVRVPALDAKPEDIAKFHKAIGVPEKAEEYEFDLGREATEQDKVVQSSIAKVMHANGVPKGAVKAVSKAVAELAHAQLAEQEGRAVKARDDAKVALSKEWGNDAPANLAIAQRAFRAFGGDEMAPLLETVVNGGKLGDHPAILKAFANIGRRMGEGEFIGAMTADEKTSAQERIQSLLRANPPGTEKYKDPAVQRELLGLYEKISPPDGPSFGGRRV